MMQKRNFALWLAIPVLTTLNQACVKLLAGHMKDTDFDWEWLTLAAHNPWTLGVLLCEGVSFLLWMHILSETNVSKATPITATAYLFILALGWAVFGEQVQALQLIGCTFILTGVWLTTS